MTGLSRPVLGQPSLQLQKLIVGFWQNPKSTAENAYGEKSPKIAIRADESISLVDEIRIG
jgi:hypothetical protein